MHPAGCGRWPCALAFAAAQLLPVLQQPLMRVLLQAAPWVHNEVLLLMMIIVMM
jgi:hypothetical protein